ncbi:hypothetical protein M501DRAFT_1001145 [Patellaria atrata CBS 101060]|uniref:TMEM205-like domain-containing protein n=1 Tax=Patellaria atrata CBS 101060 TaxID=1346257 RepID=A0A9P4VKI5_9PEZI|nr:hypothetical protein M501DRAFT_1001145 [Patellaria atrata CBS 101060]
MSSPNILMTSAPYHILSYGTLLGSTIFQSFIGGVIAFKSLPRAHFGQLQEKIFPYYFSLQTALPIILAVTYPSTTNALGATIAPGGVAGVTSAGNFWEVLVPVVGMTVSAAVNLVVVGPATTEVRRERVHLETKEGRKHEQTPRSAEMEKITKRFGMLHGVSTLLNLWGLVEMARYGVHLSRRLQYSKVF